MPFLAPLPGSPDPDLPVIGLNDFLRCAGQFRLPDGGTCTDTAFAALRARGCIERLEARDTDTWLFDVAPPASPDGIEAGAGVAHVTAGFATTGGLAP